MNIAVEKLQEKQKMAGRESWKSDKVTDIAKLSGIDSIQSLKI
jgi:hypothetical protein